MFEYIIKLYLDEKKHYEKKPSQYKWTIDNFFNTIASSSNSIRIYSLEHAEYEYKDVIHTRPEETPEFWVNFYMAWAIKLIQLDPKPSSSKQININPSRDCADPYWEKYCWTAFMIIGMILPDKQFGSSAIKAVCPGEEGYLSRFSSESIYETVFKPYLCEEVISSFLECTSLQKTFLQRVDSEKATLLYQIVNLDNDTTNSEQIKTLLGNTAFHYIDNGDINYRETENGYTALTLAAHKQKYRLVELLLNLGADPLIQNNNLELASDLVPIDSPLFTMLKGYELIYATFIGDLRKVTSILNEGADINFQGWGGYTALLIAIEHDFADLTELLLSSGADLTITCADGQGAYELVNSDQVYNVLLNTLEIPEEEEEEYPPEEDIEIPEAKKESSPTKSIEIPKAKEESPSTKSTEIPKKKEESPSTKSTEIPKAEEKKEAPSAQNVTVSSQNKAIANKTKTATKPIRRNQNCFFTCVNRAYSTVSTVFKGLKFY